MQLTFFIGWEIKSPSRSIYLNHARLFRPCRALARPRVSLISRDERDRWGRPFAPVWGVDAGSDATNSCWGRIWGLWSLCPGKSIWTLITFPASWRVPRVCLRITHLAEESLASTKQKLGFHYRFLAKWKWYIGNFDQALCARLLWRVFWARWNSCEIFSRKTLLEDRRTLETPCVLVWFSLHQQQLPGPYWMEDEGNGWEFIGKACVCVWQRPLGRDFFSWRWLIKAVQSRSVNDRAEEA